MNRDETIIGYQYMDAPNLRDSLKFGSSVCSSPSMVRGIAIHLVDERDTLRQAVRELVAACDEKYGCVRQDANLSPIVVDLLEELGLH